jgi:hypothetical protein
MSLADLPAHGVGGRRCDCPAVERTPDGVAALHE